MERNKLVFHTDRSRIIDYRRCPRKRFWGTEVEIAETEQGVRGIAPLAVNIPMTIGSAVHEGLEMLHKLHSSTMELNVTMRLEPSVVDKAVTYALGYYNGVVVREEAALLTAAQDIAQDEFAFLDAEPGAEPTGLKRAFKIREGRALVEALVRSYYKVGLPLLLDRYEILLVEKEMAALLVDNAEITVQLNGRADAILREKATGNLAALSIKTPKKLDYRADANWKEDDQGISECYLIREMVRAGLLADFGYGDFDEVQVGVQMLMLCKGYEKEDKKDGIWKHVNPVVWPYAQEQPSGEYLLRPSYDYVKEDGTMGRLGKGWNQRHLWEIEEYSQQQWIDEIVEQHPGELEKLLVFPQLLLRTNAEMDTWATEAAMQEANLATLRLDMQRAEQTGIEVNFPMVMASEFPMYRQSCNYPGPCEYKVLCHPVSGELGFGMSSVGEALVVGGLVQVEGFKVRKANHPSEEEPPV